MANGLQVRDKDDNVIFDSSTITWLQVDQFTVAKNATVTKTYDNLSGFNIIVQQQMINAPASSQESFAPKITVQTVSTNNTSVTVTPYSSKSEEVIIIVLAQG